MNRSEIEEVLFCPTGACNLRCAPCAGHWVQKRLPKAAALRFLDGCSRAGIKRVGFTGGEPFLALETLLALVRGAVKRGMLFDRIITNGVWFRDQAHLERTLRRVIDAGFDGEFCVSVDAFHEQDMKQVAQFVECAVATGRRPDIVSIASIWDVRRGETERKLEQLSKLLKGTIERHKKTWAIRSPEAFLRVHTIELSPIGPVAKEKNPWDGRWFKEDYCQGPGKTFFVLSNGDVKPCCGYASQLDDFTIGNITRDSCGQLLKNAKRHRLIATVYASGLSAIRKRLERKGVRFPGKASNHCFFCYYLLTAVPPDVLESCLDA
jgi:MoaA/NifB/PqqE/SkfB family radical SAM enzyme